MKKIIKFLINSVLKIFISKKTFFYLHDIRFLGHLINLIFIKCLKNKNIKIIFYPSQLIFKKKLLHNYLICQFAFEDINKKKISFLKNLYYFLYFKTLKNFKNTKISFSWTKKKLNYLSLYKNIFFDPRLILTQKKINKIIDSKYILFSNRDSAFKKIAHPDKDLSYHDYRNEDISSYEQAIKKFKKKNKSMNFVRYGSIVEKNCKSKEIFDYSKSPERNESNDLLLMKNCYFYVGTGSGPDILALNYQKPIVYINWLHIHNLFSFRGNQVVIFKKIFDSKKNTFLTYNELMNKNFKYKSSSDNVGSYSMSSQYKDANLKVIDNTADEIYHAIQEMHFFLKKNFKFNNNMQNKFRNNFFNYTGKKIPSDFYISEYFMKKNTKLFL